MVLDGSAFDAGMVSVSAAGGFVDYSASGRLKRLAGRGRSELIGDDVANGSAGGSLAPEGAYEVLTIPIQIALTSAFGAPMPEIIGKWNGR